ncbi:MAG: hypothetical protein HUJ68_03650 [Clostridia bacterium]|nr:hypothetical protein [Clostridia bacterium]
MNYVTIKQVKPIAEEYLNEFYDIQDYYLEAIKNTDEQFLENLFDNAKTNGITNSSRKVVILSDVYLTKDEIARAKLKEISKGKYSIVIFFHPGFFKKKSIAKMFEIAEQYIWHEATHIARMKLLKTMEAHEGDIDDLEYLMTEAELNAFAVQSLSTTDDIDLAAETYECCATDDVYDKFLDAKEQCK